MDECINPLRDLWQRSGELYFAYRYIKIWKQCVTWTKPELVHGRVRTNPSFLTLSLISLFLIIHIFWASLVAQMVKNPPAMRETWVQSQGWEDPLEDGMTTHSGILAWRIPMDRRAWRATVHGVTKSWTWLSNEAQHIHIFSLPRRALVAHFYP